MGLSSVAPRESSFTCGTAWSSINMKCPVCAAAELIHDTRDMPYTYKGETILIAAVTGDFCPACAESILNAQESDRVMREMRAFSKQVNAAIVESREKLS